MTKTIIKILIISLISLNINNTFADYKYKIEDRIKINSIDNKIKEYLSDKNTSFFLARGLKNKIQKVLGKSKKEIEEKINNKNAIYKDFKEFALTDIYSRIKIISNSVLKRGQYSSYTYKETILENDYIKILVDKKYIGDDKIELNNKTLTSTYSDGDKRNHLEFFKIKPEEKTEDYINKHFLKKEFIGKCRVGKFYRHDKKETRFPEFSIHAFGDYIDEEYPGREECGDNSNFIRISKNILVKRAYTQEYEGFDFGSIEVK